MAACTVSVLLWMVALQWTSAQDYSSQWAAHIEGGLEMAKRVTEKHGFVLLGEVNNFILFNQPISNYPEKTFYGICTLKLPIKLSIDPEFKTEFRNRSVVTLNI